MKSIIGLMKKYKSLISYAFWGVCTTVVNIAAYYVCYNCIRISNVVSTIIAWFLAVAFAFITNKLFVFDSKSFEAKLVIKETISFFSCRFLTGILDVAIMYLAVDVFASNSTVWKIISNVLVIILNYIAGKLFIFKKKPKE